MQSILHQLLHFSSPILPAVCEHLVSLHLNQSSKINLIPDPHPPLAYAYCSGEKY